VKGLIVNVLIGAGLFAGALAGALAATGRLDRAGVANIPLLNTLFPAAPAAPGAGAGADARDGSAADAHGDKQYGAPADASQPPRHDAGDAPDGQQPQQPQQPQQQPLKRGRSLFEAEKKGQGRGAEGSAEHGGKDANDSHQDPARGTGRDAAPTDPGGTAPAAPADEPAQRQPPERDLDRGAAHLQGDGSRYAPGNYFRFDGMPSGLTPEKLNEAWARVQEVTSDLTRRSQALDLRDKELREFGEDIARRQTELGKERLEVENLQRQLDERIEAFRQQVKMVRTDEIAGLTRNAQTLASFEPSKAVELIAEQWKTEGGQDEVLKTLEYMDKDAVNQILAAMPNAMIREVLRQRLQIQKEPVSSSTSGK